MSWDKVRLGTVLKQYRFEHIVQSDKEYKQVTISKHDGVCFRGVKKGREIGRKRQFIINLDEYPKTLMFVRQGVSEGAIGIAPIEVNGCIATENMPMFSIENINTEFLRFIIKSKYFHSEISKIPTTGSAQKSIHERQLLQIEIPYPSLLEQQRIVTILNRNDTLIKNLSSVHNRQLSLLKKLRQQILQDAVQGKLVAQDPNDEPASVLLERIKAEKEKLVREKQIKKEKPQPPLKPEEIPFEIPENWVWYRMGGICMKITDGTHHSPTNTETGAFKYVTAKNIKDTGIELSDMTYISEDVHKQIYTRCNPEKGDILYIKDGATTGIVTINNLSEEFSMLSSVALLKLPKIVSNKFLMYSMRSPYFYEATRNDMFGVAITRVTLEKIQNSILALPPLPEQIRIVTKIEQLMTLCDELEQSVQQNQKYTQELLQVALKEALEVKHN